MADYKHMLFFEADDLTDREKHKIRSYFQKRRDSGGGDCGMIEKAGGNTFRICFKEQEDQERVLKRKFHTISLPSGELRLTVSRSSLPQIPEQPSTSQSQTFTKASTNGLEKIFTVDIFLLHYLRDNPKANKVLMKQLSSIGCTVELNLDDEEAVVRRDSRGAFASTTENWEKQVDRAFIGVTETYICHHEVEPEKVRILLQDRSFVSDDVHVYTVNGYAVIVGELKAVKERIAILEKSMPTRKEIPVVETQFKLVEEQFIQEMSAHCPGVKIFTGNASITLEGPDMEVQSGAKRLDELIKTVKEKTVKLCSALLTFLMYRGATTKYQAQFQQTLKNPVFLEVGSDLLLCSLSSDSLDEAEAVLLKDLSVANVLLQGSASLPPELDKVKEIMIKAQNEENYAEPRVDVRFIQHLGENAGIKVQLVGYSENVNKLRKVLHDFQMNEVETQEVLKLPHFELAECFVKILNMTGVNQNKVTFRASHVPYPCVLVSGLRCHIKEAQESLKPVVAKVTTDTLVLDGPGAQRYFRAEGKVSKDLIESSCKVLIQEQQDVSFPTATSHSGSTCSVMPGPSLTSQAARQTCKTNLEIKLCSLLDEQVNVWVIPMLKTQLNSTSIGKCLLKKTGNVLKSKIDYTLAPGDILLVDAPPSLGCSKLLFIECLPWDGVRGKSVQVLRNGLKKCFDLCVQHCLSSVAFPVIGSGIALKFPLGEAVQVLTESICQFGLSTPPGSLSTIHIAIKPDHPDSQECYHEVYKQLSFNMNQEVFSGLTGDLDNVTMMVGGGVKLHLVFGDITKETTDAVVNMINFKNFNYAGVCRDILNIAGQEVEAELRAARVNQGEIFVSMPGLFPCKAILHVWGESNADLTQQLVCRIIERCEAYEYKSVAIPALCTGVGRMDPGVVVHAILQGIKDATVSMSLNSLTDIRLVLIKMDIFLAFKEEAIQMFSPALMNRVSVPQVHYVQQQQPLSSIITDLSNVQTPSRSRQSVFLFLGLSRGDVNNAMAKLKDLYQAQCSTQTYKKEELAGLTKGDMQDLKQLLDTYGLYLQMHQSGHGSLTVSGLKDGVNQVMQKISASLHGRLRREMKVKEEEDLYIRVAWCILGHNGNWERLPKTANYNLENNDIAGGITDAQGTTWSVDLQRLEATRPLTRQTARLKRLQNLPDFTLPLYWDNMAAGEDIKVVELHRYSQEYQTVKQAFNQTATQTVLKIQRLQNLHLRRAYEVQKKNISEKNKQKDAGEKLLFHGTTKKNCIAIMKTGFNRSFAGQNATSYGHGTYFAVNARYSAHPTYAQPAADHTQLMFVVRVLTGIYSQGHSDMRVPPLLKGLHSQDRCDSVVDALEKPKMYVVFHDSQAYPDYLITFR